MLVNSLSEMVKIKTPEDTVPIRTIALAFIILNLIFFDISI